MGKLNGLSTKWGFMSKAKSSDNAGDALIGAVIENHTYHAMRRFDFEVGCAYAADVDQTRLALERALRSVELVAATPAAEPDEEPPAE